MSGEGFLTRWSKRKQEVARETIERDVAPMPDNPPEVIVESIEPHDPEAITPEELAALPPIEEITDAADFSQYLRKGVPAILRNAAMRRMWLLDPAIRDYVDPALDYAYNWNIPGGVPGNGALAAGFDAKGAAEKFFSTMRGKISNETGEFAEADEQSLPSGDKLSQKEEAAPSTPHASSMLAELGAGKKLEKSSIESAKEFDHQHSTLVVCEDEVSAKPDQKTNAGQGSSRRHGRALPV
jgi:hypothetical protein